MKTSSIKPRKYGRNHEFQGDNVVIINEEDDNIDNYSRSKNDNNSTGCRFYIIMFLIL